MKQTSIINIHSFVDLITNSSSELFVCDTDKSIEAVKEVVEKIIQHYYIEMEEKPPHNEKIWTEIFTEPTIATFNFDIDEYPKKEDLDVLSRESNDIYGKIYVKIREWEEKNPCPVGVNVPDRYNNKQYKRWEKKREAFSRPLYNEAYKNINEAEKRIVDYFKIPEKYEYIVSYSMLEPYRYRTVIKKGDIILESAYDNSVPYECFDRINNILNGFNIHIG